MFGSDSGLPLHTCTHTQTLTHARPHLCSSWAGSSPTVGLSHIKEPGVLWHRWGSCPFFIQKTNKQRAWDVVQSWLWHSVEMRIWLCDIQRDLHVLKTCGTFFFSPFSVFCPWPVILRSWINCHHKKGDTSELVRDLELYKKTMTLTCYKVIGRFVMCAKQIFRSHDVILWHHQNISNDTHRV